MDSSILKLTICFFIIIGTSVAREQDSENYAEETKSFFLEKDRINQHIRHVAIISQKVECIRDKGKIGKSLSFIEVSLNKFNAFCAGEINEGKQYISCLSMGTEVLHETNNFLRLHNHNECPLEKMDLAKFEGLATLFQQNIEALKNGYKNYLLNYFYKHREEKIKEINSEMALFDCRIQARMSFKKLMIIASDTAVAYQRGDLYKGNIGFIKMTGYMNKINILAEMCFEVDDEILSESQRKISWIKKKFDGQNYKQASEKACRLLKEKTQSEDVINLCERPLDNDSYRFSVSKSLSIYVLTRGEINGK